MSAEINVGSVDFFNAKYSFISDELSFKHIGQGPVKLSQGASISIGIPVHVGETKLSISGSYSQWQYIDDDLISHGADNSYGLSLGYPIKKFTKLEYSPEHLNDKKTFSIISNSKVGATVAKDITSSSKKSIFISFKRFFKSLSL